MPILKLTETYTQAADWLRSLCGGTHVASLGRKREKVGEGAILASTLPKFFGLKEGVHI